MDEVTALSGRQLSKQEFKKQIREVWKRHASVFAETANGETLPLKIGIASDIVANNPDIKRFVVGEVMKQHVKKDRYLRALAIGGPRYGLDGSPCGEVSDPHRLFAIHEIKVRMNKGKK